ncbi:MAG: glutathione S-transferase [Massilia sp.]
MLEILGKSTSINVRKVLWTCAEIELAYDNEQWGAGFRPTDDPAFAALNPNKMVPVIRDDGVVLWESNTICRYLAAKHGRLDLLPRDPAARAQIEKWMDWQATELNNAWRYAFMALVRQSAAHTVAGEIAASVDQWNARMGILDAQLERTGAYVAGADFTLADIVLGLSMNRWRMTPMARPAYAALDAWRERLLMRPGFVLHGENGIA